MENERTAGGTYDGWKDVTGERYHYPNQYKNKIVSGRTFIYYRGARRADGSRATPEYFGMGIIGEVYRDPDIPETAQKRNWAWFCEIEDYTPFKTPVPFRIEEKHFERISQNQWGVAVRDLPENVFEAILSHAGVAAPLTAKAFAEGYSFSGP